MNSVEANSIFDKVKTPSTVQKTSHVKSIGAFGSLEVRTNPGKKNASWREMFARFEAEKGAYASCDTRGAKCHPRMKQWRVAIKRMKNLSGPALLSAVNREINLLVRYASDARARGVRDVWSTPAETLSGTGDCEDYAILKYATLSELGIKVEQMKIVVVKDEKRRMGHAVLAVRTGTRIDILDNLRNEPENHVKINSYTPVYSINQQGRWLNLKMRKRTVAVASIAPITPLSK